jgi:hypothetical protein
VIIDLASPVRRNPNIANDRRPDQQSAPREVMKDRTRSVSSNPPFHAMGLPITGAAIFSYTASTSGPSA